MVNYLRSIQSALAKSS